MSHCRTSPIHHSFCRFFCSKWESCGGGVGRCRTLVGLSKNALSSGKTGIGYRNWRLASTRWTGSVLIGEGHIVIWVSIPFREFLWEFQVLPMMQGMREGFIPPFPASAGFPLWTSSDQIVNLWGIRTRVRVVEILQVNSESVDCFRSLSSLLGALLLALLYETRICALRSFP